MRTQALFFLTVFIVGITLVSCSNSDQQLSEQQHAKKVNQWHKNRIDSLKEKDSWLSLAGLFKLKKGINTLGSDSSNSLIFPKKAPAEIGTLTVSDSTFLFKANPKVSIYQDGEKISTQELYLDSDRPSAILKHASLRWYIIERRGQLYLRLKDTEHPNFANFSGIERFPISQKWRIKARFNRFNTPKTISIPDVFGDVYQDSLYGTLDFNIDGHRYRLAPLGNPETDREFFIILGDQTNGQSTYSGGRYLYIPTPKENGITYIDFNKAYNPPCVFTRFATCPLPPARNKLPVKITAGEKLYQTTANQ